MTSSQWSRIITCYYWSTWPYQDNCLNCNTVLEMDHFRARRSSFIYLKNNFNQNYGTWITFCNAFYKHKKDVYVVALILCDLKHARTSCTIFVLFYSVLETIRAIICLNSRHWSPYFWLPIEKCRKKFSLRCYSLLVLNTLKKQTNQQQIHSNILHIFIGQDQIRKLWEILCGQ